MDKKIDAIITDVDGVMIGNRKGVNFPYPSNDVTNALVNISNKIPVILCSGKYKKTVADLAIHLGLNNYHIADGGSSIFNPYTGDDIGNKFIDNDFVSQFIDNELLDSFHVEFYYADNYKLINDSKIDDFILNKRVEILGDQPIKASRQDILNTNNNLLKLVVVVKDDEKDRLNQLVDDCKSVFGEVASFWTSHPYLENYSLFVITPNGVSKNYATKEIISKLGLSDNILGIGDSFSDWSFMQNLKYVACIKNSQECALESIIREQRKDNFVIAKSVNEDGLMDVFNELSLI
jgi:hydroxymethylpyrimidine pyrophosphatase-like HAD family hydrolase